METVTKLHGDYENICYGVSVVKGWPPVIAEIRKVLPVTANNIFAYDGKIYSPATAKLSRWLVAHECVHFDQQAAHPGGVRGWWYDFLYDKQFRLEQEIPAHQREWRTWLNAQPRNRKERRLVLKQMAKRLSAPMYGGIISFEQAKRAINPRQGARHGKGKEESGEKVEIGEEA